MSKITLLKYKGILFDEWQDTVEDGVRRIWSEMCSMHTKQYENILKNELDYAGAVGCCSVYECGDIPAADNKDDEIGNAYIDFDIALVEFIEIENED